MIFVDTGAFLARWIARDEFHDHAVATWKQLATLPDRPATSSFVVDETLTLLGRRAGHGFAAARARELYASEALTILRPEEADERAAVDLFERFADQRVSFTDCVSFALMNRYRIERAFTFDRHFVLAGFQAIPSI